MEALFPDTVEPKTPLAIKDHEVGPHGTDIANAISDLGEELRRPPEVGRRAKRKFPDSLWGANRCHSLPDRGISAFTG